MEELLLWRWSTAVQITSSLIVTVFFAVFRLSTARRELDWWVAAWLSNSIALLVTWLFWYAQPTGLAVTGLKFAYFLTKTGFIALLLIGTLAFVGDAPLRPARWKIAVPVLAFAVGCALLDDDVAVIGTLQSSAIALVLLAAALLCLRAPGRGLGWLCVGFLLRAALATAESAAYGLTLFVDAAELPGWIGIFLASHSSFDTGAEWTIALGGVLAWAHRTQSELVRSHAELSQAHEELQHVVEHDPLTGLYNRRMLPQLFEQVAGSGAALLFFDLDDFKQINDRDGHHVGDASLKRFAAALRDAFPSEHALVRYAGDEFLLIAGRTAPAQLHARIADLRMRLLTAQGDVPPIRFSVGIEPLPPGGDARAALRQADAAMYRQKAVSKSNTARSSG